jgi:hypothetical protein
LDYSEYVIRGSKPWDAKIFLEGEEIAKISKGEDLTSKLISKDGHEWILTNNVHSEFRPFSISVLDSNKGKADATREVLTIRDHVFKHKGKFYMLTNHPEGRPWHEYLSGPRYICRLDNFPYSDLREVDHHTKHKLRRFRGVAVGEATGLGISSHHVKLAKELQDIGLFIAAASYMIYCTA